MNRRRNSKPPRIRRRSPRVGDRISLQWGPDKVAAIITDDRGPIGRGGRRIVTIRLPEIGREFDIAVELLGLSGR